MTDPFIRGPRGIGRWEAPQHSTGLGFCLAAVWQVGGLTTSQASGSGSELSTP